MGNSLNFSFYSLLALRNELNKFSCNEGIKEMLKKSQDYAMKLLTEMKQHYFDYWEMRSKIINIYSRNKHEGLNCQWTTEWKV